MRTADDAFRDTIALDAHLDAYKASFGGDRSAAGRYAAEQRWKGHVKQDNHSPAAGSFGKVLGLKAAKQQYGASPKGIAKFFKDKHGLSLDVQDFEEGSADEQAVYGVVQSLDDLLSNGFGFSSNIRSLAILTYETESDGAVEIMGDGTAEMNISASSIATTAARVFNGELPKGYSTTADFASENNPPLDVLTQRLGYAIMIHEFAHAWDVNPSSKEAKTGRYFLSDSLDHSGSVSVNDLKRITEILRATAISGYGATNRQEFVAEAFTAWILGNKQAEKLVRPWLDLLPTDILKASFGGDRSAAGRYAAEQRWKGHVKGQVQQPSDAKKIAELDPRNSWNDVRSFGEWSEDFTKRMAHTLAERFDFVQLTEAVLVQRTIGDSDANPWTVIETREGVRSLQLFSAYKTELAGVTNGAEMSSVLETLSKQDNQKPRLFDSWEEERLELIRLSGIAHNTDDALTQADILAHGLKQGWTSGTQDVKGVFASVAREALGASSNRRESEEYERKHDENFTYLLQQYPAAKQVFEETFKQMHADTQQILKRILPEGTTHVRLFRGTALTDEQLQAARNGSLDVSTVSSWTQDRRIATQFQATDKQNSAWASRTVGGEKRLTVSVLTGVVPIGSVLALNRQGFGTLGEAEMVVLGPSVQIDKVETGSALQKARVRCDAMIQAALAKASFGGDRSAAGRYAAEQRWKGHVKREPATDEASQKLKEEFESPQDKIPNSPPNPKGLNPRAVYNWVDGPFRRDHPRQFPINDMIRHIACGLLGLPLPRWRSINFRKNDTYIHDEDFVNRTKNLIESIDAATPNQPTLWRGLRGSYGKGTTSDASQVQQVANLQVGDSFVSPIFSSSRSKDVAQLMYGIHSTQQGDPPSIIIKIEAGAKGLRTSVIPNDHEVLTGGKFVVTARTESKQQITSGSETWEHPFIVIAVRQVDTFGKEDYTNPNFRPDSKYDKRRLFPQVVMP